MMTSNFINKLRGSNFRAWLVLLCLGWCLNHGQGQVVLNELMADNRSAVVHAGQYPDWIELYNPSTTAVQVAGMCLTDDLTLPRQFVFPAGVTVPARGYLLVWCTTNSTVPGLRAPFGLGSKTDRVWLLAADGATILDHVAYGLQAPDLSIGRVPNGSGGWALNEPTPEGPNEAQALASPVGLRINEWLAMPGAGNDDWLELFNTAALPVELSGHVVTDRPSGTPTNRAIPPLSYIAGHGFVQLFASDLDEADADHLDFKLGSSGEVVTLYQSNRSTIIDRIQYGQQVSLASQGRVPDGGSTIVTFQPSQVTPGAPNYALVNMVVISEVLSHTDPPLEDAIELCNESSETVDISYWWLSDSASELKKYRIPPGTVLPPGGFVVFYAQQFGPYFMLDSAEGDEVYLSAADAAGNLDSRQSYVKFGALKNGVSVGRYRTSLGVEFVPMSRRTFGVDQPQSLPEFRSGRGASNAPPRVGPVVINEIFMSAPESLGLDVEYLELHNPTSEAVPLFDPLYPTNQWRIRNGISYRFPPGVTLPAGGYLLVVNFDPVAQPQLTAQFRQTFQVPSTVPIYGPYEGRLSDAGEIVELQWPDTPQTVLSDRPGFVPYEMVERIQYGFGGTWPAWETTALMSLQRRESLSFGNEPLNWRAGAPTAGRANASDGDRDGMPDDWELAHQLNPAINEDAHADLDGDGATNLEEYLMGTHPGDGTSVFRLHMESSVGGMELQFVVNPGRNYFVEYATGVPGPWQTLTNFTGITEPGTRVYRMPAGGVQGFYRVRGEISP